MWARNGNIAGEEMDSVFHEKPVCRNGNGNNLIKPYSPKLSLSVRRVVDGVRLLFGGLLTPSKSTTLWADH